ncbi:MAG: DUF962 domain-containing protein [bacterium]|nr:DUF962 domain-containing protein [bacterium]
MTSWLDNWFARHRHPASLALHAVGIPVLVAVPVVAVVQLVQGRWDVWWRPVGMLVISYLLQWIGHRIEGNDMGEVVLIKKLLGRPYTAIAPRYKSDHPTASNPTADRQSSNDRR